MNPAEIIFKALLPTKLQAVRHLDIGSRGPQQLAVKLSPAPDNLLCCEIDEATIASCRKPCFYGDALELVKYLKPGSFDLITALDVIEHLPKADGLRLIDDMESLCSGRIIWATPNGPWAVYPGVKYHCHLSGWLPGEFTARGYSILLIPHQLDTGWFYAIKDRREPVVKPNLPKMIAPFDVWEWMD
jgi:hypothetical protein